MQNNQVYFLEQEDFNQVGLEENSFPILFICPVGPGKVTK